MTEKELYKLIQTNKSGFHNLCCKLTEASAATTDANTLVPVYDTAYGINHGFTDSALDNNYYVLSGATITFHSLTEPLTINGGAPVGLNDAIITQTLVDPACNKTTTLTGNPSFNFTGMVAGTYKIALTNTYASGFKITTYFEIAYNGSTTLTMNKIWACSNSNQNIYDESVSLYKYKVLIEDNLFLQLDSTAVDGYILVDTNLNPAVQIGELSTEQPTPLLQNCCDCNCTPYYNSFTFTVTAEEITRPANATPYTAKDVVGTQFTLDGAFQKYQGKGYITKIRVMSDTDSEVWKPKLHFYSTSPTAVTDNSPLGILYTQNSIRLGAIELPALSTEDSGASNTATSMWTAGRADSAGLAQGILPVYSTTNDLYCILETLDAFTPTSGGKFYIEVTVENIG